MKVHDSESPHVEDDEQSSVEDSHASDADFESEAASSAFSNEQSDGDCDGEDEHEDEDVASKDSHDDDGPSRHGSNKRQREDDAACRQFKRQRGAFSADYLDLLNRDIEDAAHGLCLDDDFGLPHSQVGLSAWSPLEKQQLLEAVARLGRHDLAGIASRVGSKSAIEVRHYLLFLQEAHGLRRRSARESLLELAEYPAAVELSPQCCHAQEEAADAVSLRQELRETQREAMKWGDYWDVTPSLAAALDGGLDGGLDEGLDAGARQALPFAHMFHVGRWLKLSERFFMNSSVPAGNWRFVGDAAPSIWATALDDFHSLAVSVTRRLVQTTLFISMSRIRAKRRVTQKTRDIVHAKDVEAAVNCLGLAPDARRLWLGSARRLRLHVHRKLPSRMEAAEEPMTYDEVEDELGARQLGGGGDAGEPVEVDKAMMLDSSASDPSASDSSAAAAAAAADDDDDDDEPSAGEREHDEIRREANEVLLFSAVDLRDVRSARQPLEQRIAAERAQERQAERWDEHAGRRAEAAMWSALHREPPADAPRAQEPGPLQRSRLDVEGMYPLGGDWAGQLEYRGEWEAGRRGR